MTTRPSEADRTPNDAADCGAPGLRQRRRGADWWSPERQARRRNRKQVAISLLGMYSMLSNVASPLIASIGSGTAAATAVGTATLLAADDSMAQQPGPKGQKGEQGAVGPKGERGTEGAQGEKGAQGAQGTDGAQGEKGAQGAQGTDGAQGEKGEQGIQGLKGAMGEQGTDGAQGAKGERGEQGVQGAAAAKGETGERGAQGIQGEKGKSAALVLTPEARAAVRTTAADLKASDNKSDRQIGRLLEHVLTALQGDGGQAAEPAPGPAPSDSLTLLRYAARPETDAAAREAAVTGAVIRNDERIAANRRDIEGLRHSFHRLRGETRESTAIAIALGGVDLPIDKDRSVTVQFGNYEGANALALGAGFRLSDGWQVEFGAAIGLRYNQTGFRAGMTYGW